MVGAVSRAASSPTGGQSAFEISANQFLSLLLTQLKNQDPNNAMDESQFAQQLALLYQTSAVENIRDQVAANSNQLGLITASTMLGRTVKLGEGADAHTGEVQAVAVNSDSGVQVMVDDNYYDLDNVKEVY